MVREHDEETDRSPLNRSHPSQRESAAEAGDLGNFSPDPTIDHAAGRTASGILGAASPISRIESISRMEGISGIAAGGHATPGWATGPVDAPPPNTIFYRGHESRPTIRDLRFKLYGEGSGGAGSGGGSATRDLAADLSRASGAPAGGGSGADEKRKDSGKFGMVDGVVVGCLLNIWGVILFLRLGWVIGTAGVGFGTLVMLLAMTVTTITTLSLSAICTNGEVKGGGAYYLISRSLGPSFGGAIGLLFFIANAVAVALYLVGFAETVAGISESNLFDGHDSWDIRVYGIVACVFLFFLAMIGVAWVVKTQAMLLALLVVSISVFIIGTFMHHSEEDTGFTGYRGSTFSDNFGPREGFTVGTFFEVFGVFFPAVTGIMAGANISGDLRDPQHAIPKGTLIAIVISGVSYVACGWIAGAVVARGDYDGGGGESADPDAAVGLINDNLIFQRVSAVEALVVVGIFAATLSSALASLVGAPRVLQSLTADRLFPVLNGFSVGYGPRNEPIRAYVATFVIAVVMILVGDLNTIASLITNFFLVSYALVNYACFAASYWRAPGWRPSFRWYSMWTSLVGAVVCVAIMFLISWITAMITLLAGSALFTYLYYARPDVNWGSAGQSRAYLSATRLLLKLGATPAHVKTFRPSFLVLTGEPADRPDLLTAVAYLNKKGKGAVFCANVLVRSAAESARKGAASGVAEAGEAARLGVLDPDTAEELLAARSEEIERELLALPAFYEVVAARTLREGVQSLLQLCGVGRLRPNTLVMGYKRDWRECGDAGGTGDYVMTITDAFDLSYGVAVLRPTEREDLPLLPSGPIDVWWLSDDGGLTLLLPFILGSHEHWRQCPLRVFTLCPRGVSVEDETERMRELMRKFRIAATVKVIPDGDGPSADRLASFLAGAPPGANAENSAHFVRTGEHISAHSSDAALVFVTLPIPAFNTNPLLYMSWLDTLSKDLPPVIFIRGNHSSVLTIAA